MARHLRVDLQSPLEGLVREEAATRGQRGAVERPRGLAHWGAFREGLGGSAPLRTEVGVGRPWEQLCMHNEVRPAEGQQSAQDSSLLSVCEETGVLCHRTWG